MVFGEKAISGVNIRPMAGVGELGEVFSVRGGDYDFIGAGVERQCLRGEKDVDVEGGVCSGRPAQLSRLRP